MEMQRKVMPAIALRGLTVFPRMIVHFDVSRQKSIEAVERAMANNGELFLVSQISPETENPGFDDLYKVGTIVTVKQIIKMPDKVLRVLVEGKERARFLGIEEDEACIVVNVEEKPVFVLDRPKPWEEAACRILREQSIELWQKKHGKGKAFAFQIEDCKDLKDLTDVLCLKLDFEQGQKQELLELDTVEERYLSLATLLKNELEIASIKGDLQSQLKKNIDKNQKEYILREQMKLIHEELEEEDCGEIGQYQKALKELDAGEEIKEKIQKEIDRLKSISYNSSEGTVVRGYIETLLSLPWEKASEDNTDIKAAAKILEDEHFGLDKVKERVVESLAVRILTGKGNGSILCLVGPPGTGKTSIARSVANALNKKYIRICLGGVRDEAEIRGHRKTYVGAMPGRIAVGLKQAGVKNPLMLLDEIDKVNSDYKGDPASALLEVLDSEQNSRFQDHYLEVPLDLSEVFFLATANDISTIPRPLLDRMEIIEVSGYTANEKMHIAKDYLLKKQLEKNGLKKKQLTISDTALEKVIQNYTREAGVRNLERSIGKICRKAARQILEGESTAIRVSGKNLEEYLGVERYRQDIMNKKDQVGIVRGLAWTSVGGDTLEIEVNVMPGKGEFLLTGKMGDVMKESAQAGISYIRSVAKKYSIEPEFFKENDIHIHIPEGAVPKDGPSAGVTMAVAMLSAITGNKVRKDIAMTGEITLRGRVLAVGGLKEKILAAKTFGSKLVFVPKENEKDIAEIPEEIKEGLTINFAEHVEDIIKEAFANGN